MLRVCSNLHRLPSAKLMFFACSTCQRKCRTSSPTPLISCFVDTANFSPALLHRYGRVFAAASSNTRNIWLHFVSIFRFEGLTPNPTRRFKFLTTGRCQICMASSKIFSRNAVARKSSVTVGFCVLIAAAKRERFVPRGPVDMDGHTHFSLVVEPLSLNYALRLIFDWCI